MNASDFLFFLPKLMAANPEATVAFFSEETKGITPYIFLYQPTSL